MFFAPLSSALPLLTPFCPGQYRGRGEGCWYFWNGRRRKIATGADGPTTFVFIFLGIEGCCWKLREDVVSSVKGSSDGKI